MEDILNKFCSRDETRSRMLEPFSIGDYTYATDGHSCIRVAKIKGIDSKEDALNIDTLLNWDHDHIKEWVKLPEFELDPSNNCSYCKGTKKSENCPECEGEGEVEFLNGFNHYCNGCATCDGDGLVLSESKECTVCNGTGLDLSSPIAWERGLINTRFIEQIRPLPGVLISPCGGENDPIRYKFDGGCGFIMPMKD